MTTFGVLLTLGISVSFRAFCLFGRTLCLFNSIISSETSISAKLHNGGDKYKNLFFLFFAMALLLVGSHLTVTSATVLANALNIAPILVGMLVVSLGTTMPELFYSLKSVKKTDDELAIGDILGTVLADATIVVGILAFINPFSFPIGIVYVTGAFMIVASLVLLKFMHSGRVITKKEGYMLLAFWVVYVVVELLANG